ncbi:slc47a1, partial [Symbiodinium necroappetens]
MVTRVPKVGAWELMKNLKVNRRGRKKLLRAESWILRWDPPTVDRSKDALRHLSYVGGTVYVDMNTLLVESQFDEVWKVVQWAVLSGRVGTIVSRDCGGTPLDKVIGAPHRSKVHFLHALASASREYRGGGMVKLYVEDLDRVNKIGDVDAVIDPRGPLGLDAMNTAAGHQHRSTLHPMAYSLSVDVVGPLKGYGLMVHMVMEKFEVIL